MKNNYPVNKSSEKRIIGQERIERAEEEKKSGDKKPGINDKRK